MIQPERGVIIMEIAEIAEIVEIAENFRKNRFY